MNDLKIFENPEFGSVRVIEKDGEPWFVGKDVATILGYTNTRDALIKHVDDEDKGVANCDTLGGKQKLTIINESGLYSLILSSKLPTSKKFKRWITSEVLPSIRRTGSYSLVDTSQLSPQLQALNQIVQVLNQQEMRVNQLESRIQVIQTNLLPQNKFNWREYVNKVLNKIGQKIGDYQKIRTESYKELEKRAACNLKVRLDNLKGRALAHNKPLSYIRKLNYLDILEDEQRLREIYLTIIREYAIKYEIEVA